MGLVAITDFDAELRLLGLYEREVMRTGILDYPAQWPLPQLPQAIAIEEPVSPEPLPEPSPKVLPEPTAPIVSEHTDLPPVAEPCQTDAPAISQPVNNVQVIIHADELSVPVAPEATIPAQETEALASTPCPIEARRQALLTEQDMERRLFYLFTEELEHTGDLRKFPAVLRPASRT
jgi:hypothetical protein